MDLQCASSLTLLCIVHENTRIRFDCEMATSGMMMTSVTRTSSDPEQQPRRFQYHWLNACVDLSPTCGSAIPCACKDRDYGFWDVMTGVWRLAL